MSQDGAIMTVMSRPLRLVVAIAAAKTVALAISVSLVNLPYAAAPDRLPMQAQSSPQVGSKAMAGDSPMSRCMAAWDPARQMPKPEWKETCAQRQRLSKSIEQTVRIADAGPLRGQAAPCPGGPPRPHGPASAHATRTARTRLPSLSTRVGRGRRRRANIDKPHKEAAGRSEQ